MTAEQWEKLREWIKAEIDAKIADSRPGLNNCYNTGYSENKEADRLFKALLLERE